MSADEVTLADLEYNTRYQLTMKRANKLLRIILVIAVAAGMVVLVVFMSQGRGGGEPKDSYHSPTVFAMDTTLDITIQGMPREGARESSDAAVRLARDIESHASRFVATSDVSAINRNAGTAPVRVHDDVLFMLQKALEYGSLTGGEFDVTVGPLARLWGFYDQKYRVPSQSEIDSVLPLVDYRNVTVDPAAKTVMLTRKGMDIDLGGIAKGYAVQCMYELLRDRGVRSALINFGGAVGALGRRSDGRKWVIGIRHPRVEGELAGELQVEDAFVSSSGDYERYFIRDGRRYCHIFDPKTGRQPGEAISTTIVGPDSTADDVLSTAVFVLGPRRGLELVEGMAGFQALVVEPTGTVVTTPKMRTEYALEMPERI